MYSILDYCLSLFTLFDNTDHIGYFNKVNIGSKQRFNHDPNPILNLVILSYLRQLQQLFYQVGEGVQEWDWNDYGRYKTTTDLKNLGMSKANSGNQVLITDVSYFYFKPDENRKDVITTLEEWTARLLKPNITEQNQETRKRLGRAKEPSTFVKFKLSTTNYSTKLSTKPASKQPNTSINLDVSPTKHKSKSADTLMLDLNSFFTTSIAAIETKKCSSKQRLSSEQLASYTSTSAAASSFIRWMIHIVKVWMK